MRRPVFWFLWPASEPGPLDGAAVQSRWVRVCSRGPWRWAFLLLCTALVVTAVSAAVASTLAAPGILTIMLGVVIAVPLIALLSRAWVAGTYISDRGIKISGVITTTVITWPRATALVLSPGSRWLGLPLRIRGEQVALDTDEGCTATHIETASPDLWLRPQAYAAAVDRLRTWHRETR